MLAQAIAGALDMHDDGVVKQPVQQGGGDHGIAKNIAPFGKAAIGRQYHRALLVASVDELEEQVASASADGEIADLIDDQQRAAAEEPDALAQATFSIGLGQGIDDIGERGEVDAAAGADGLDAKRYRQVTLFRYQIGR